ncbi:patatin-like phospholipase family protein [Nocardioides coralli]|uniref:patatin-like phospholipase family protein n=1 Tax=Nocardioides coralli TaxID=2872154 RepID=UPI001CA41DB2|nr:patatin-like phospholipase family protein [Nocardioides coralli]QZY29288.1 patatin-like phospholipase family protein [Nocardioides coralli]
MALALDAGGARSAYQVGALQVLLPELAAADQRPTLLVGTSAGALLTGALTATAHLDAEEQAARLLDVLGQATKDAVMQPLWRQVPVVALRYASETLGVSRFRLRGLFGTGPLGRTLGEAIDWDQLHRNVAEARVDVSAVVSTSVRSGRVTVFAERSPDAAPLPRPAAGHHRRYVDTRLDVEHLMASAAIPALFPSVRVSEPPEAAGWYVDGATRRRVPLAPAVELGGARLVAIGTGSLHPPLDDPERDRVEVDLADGAATLLGAVMDDPLRHDLRRLGEVNQWAGDSVLARHLDQHRSGSGREPLRVIPYVAVSPSRSEVLADIAMEVFRSNHRSLRRTLGDPDLHLVHRLLGSDSPLQGELLSYLLFDPDFFEAAAAVGRQDAEAWVASHPDLWRTEPLANDDEAEGD